MGGDRTQIRMLTAACTLVDELTRAEYCDRKPFCSATVTPTSGGCLSTTSVHSPVAALNDVRVVYAVLVSSLLPDSLDSSAADVGDAVGDAVPSDVVGDSSINAVPEPSAAVSLGIWNAVEVVACKVPIGDMCGAPAIPSREGLTISP